MEEQGFKGLKVWRKAMDLCRDVYELSRKLPESERYGLASQMRRSAASVPSNIAEGYGRQIPGDYRHHLQIARGSVAELETQLILCDELKLMKDGTTGLQARCEEVNRMLRALIGAVAAGEKTGGARGRRT